MKDNKLKNNYENNQVNILFPAIVFFVINVIVQYLQEMQSYGYVMIFSFLIQMITYNLITQSLAYLTCRFFVIKKSKGQNGVWINYIIWIIVMNLGIIVEMINK